MTDPKDDPDKKPRDEAGRGKLRINKETLKDLETEDLRVKGGSGAVGPSEELAPTAIPSSGNT